MIRDNTKDCRNQVAASFLVFLYLLFMFFWNLDEKERYDPVGFRDAIISGLDQCTDSFEAISRFLDGAGNKQDYRRYGESLFDILIAGGILG